MKQAGTTRETSFLDPGQALPLYLDALFRAPESELAATVTQEEQGLVDCANNPGEGSEEHPANAVPAWAQRPFKSILVETAGMTVAVPIHNVASIVKRPGRLNKLPDQSENMLGVVRYRGQNVPVYDIERIFNTGSGQGVSLQPEIGTQCPEHIMVLAQGQGGIVCDRVNRHITLTADQVQWRRFPSRPWHAGIVTDALCTLLDVEALMVMFHPDMTPGDRDILP